MSQLYCGRKYSGLLYLKVNRVRHIKETFMELRLIISVYDTTIIRTATLWATVSRSLCVTMLNNRCYDSTILQAAGLRSTIFKTQPSATYKIFFMALGHLIEVYYSTILRTTILLCSTLCYFVT